MTVSLNSAYTLSEQSHCNIELCKIALERSNGDHDKATNLLRKWTAKEEAICSDKHGIIDTYFNGDNDVASIVELTSTNSTLTRTPQFKELADSIVAELTYCDNFYVEKPTLERMEKENDCKIKASYARMEKSSTNSLLTTFTHLNKRIGVIVETSVENKAVRLDNRFRRFSFQCALHIAACDPHVVSRGNIPERIKLDLVQSVEADLFKQNKPMVLWESIIAGKIEKWAESHSLLTQEWSFGKETVDSVVNRLGQELNSKIEIKQFVRFAL